MVIKEPTPKSSFLSVEKDINILINRMLSDERLKRLLFYESKDCLNKPNLSEADSVGLIGTRIKYTPKIKVDEESLVYIVIMFSDFMPTNNPEYRDNTITFAIVCHFDLWNLEGINLRPFKIAGEIDSLFNNQKLTGIGELQFMGATQEVLSEEYGAIIMSYQATHGDEDKKVMGNPLDETRFQEDWKDFIENDKSTDSPPYRN